MNITRIAKYLKLRRELTEEEFHYAEFLGGLTETERTTLSELIQPAAKASKPATKKLKQCGTCGISKRAAHHRDVNHHQYHVFDEGGSKGKSKRAESLAGKIQGAVHDLDGGVSKIRPDLCAYKHGRMTCKGAATDAIHDPAMGYGGYHEFQSAESAQAAPGD